jgi:hypothetical protein
MSYFVREVLDKLRLEVEGNSRYVLMKAKDIIKQLENIKK